MGRLGQFNLNAVSPDYFATMGTRIVRGRGFTDADGAAAPRAMVVSESMAKVLWPGRDAIGQCIRVTADTMPCTYVVGIAENIKDHSLSDDPGFYYYLPAAQFNPQTGGLFVRTHGSAAAHARGDCAAAAARDAGAVVRHGHAVHRHRRQADELVAARRDDVRGVRRSRARCSRRSASTA